MENQDAQTPATPTGNQNFSEQPQPAQPQPSVRERRREKGNKKFPVRLLIIILILVAIGGGAWFLLREPNVDTEDGNNTGSLTQLSTPSNTPTQSPTPAQVERSEVSIEILNGTGIAGEAGFLQGELEDLGYENIEVDNADNKDFKTTEVTFSSSLPEDTVDEITQALKDIYDKVETQTSSSLSTDVRIITGYKKGHTATATPAPTSASTPTPTDSVSGTPTETPTPTP